MSDPVTTTTVFYRDFEQRLNVGVLADRVLFSGDPAYGGTLALLSILGPHSAVRGVLAAAASRRELRAACWPAARLYGEEGGRILTQALSKSVTHGIYLGPELLLSTESGPMAVLDPVPERIFARLNHRYALPARAAWAEWLGKALEKERHLAPLAGFGASGCRITAAEETLDQLVSSGVRDGSLQL